MAPLVPIIEIRGMIPHLPDFFCLELEGILRVIRKHIVLCFLLLAVGFIPSAWAGENSSVQSDVLNWLEKNEVHKETVWLKLLHLNGSYQSQMTSTIITDDFFLGGREPVSPKVEMMQAVDAFFEPISDTPDKHPLCRFPARAYWLNSRLKTAGLSLPVIDCPALDDWANWQQLESVGLVMASGYFGNPASSFGHVLIKVNNSGFDTGGELLEKSINFGALIPPKEPALIYVLKGLFGGYVAGFSDKKFYLQDMIYSRTEFRDIWEYELALSDFQKKLFLRHLWELVGQKYVYYFLKQNCAYRVAELVELVTDRSLIDRKQVYLPTDLFHRLVEAKNLDGASLVSQVEAYPSAQRLLYDEYDALNPKQQQALNRLIENPDELSSVMTSLGELHKLGVVNAGLSYYDYRIGGLKEKSEKGDVDALEELSRLEGTKRLLLLERLALPPGHETGLNDLNRVPEEPTKGNGMRLLRVGVGNHQDDKAFFSVGGALAHSDLVGNYKGGLDNTELKVLDFQFSGTEDENWELEYIDLVRVSDLNPPRSALPGERSKSWRVALGARRSSFEVDSQLTGFVEGGIGKSNSVGAAGFAYGMADLAYESQKEEVFAGPALGMVFDLSSRVGIASEYSYKKGFKSGEELKKGTLELRWSPFRNHELRVKVVRQDRTKASFVYHRSW